MSKERDSVESWLKRINDAKAFRDREKDTQQWDKYLEGYSGKYNLGDIMQHMAVIPINLVFAYIHTEIPKLYFKDPHIAVNPKGAANIKSAKITEVAINYLFNELNIKKEVFKVLLDTLLIGHGWFKFGYSGTFGQMTTAEDVKNQKKNDKPLDEVREYVKSEEMFVLHVPWEDMVFDTLSKEPPYDCRWMAHRIIKTLDSVKKSEMYKNAETLESNYTPKDFKESQSKDTPLVELWEIWDKESNSVYVVTSGMEKFLRNGPNPYQMEGLPFSMLKFNLVPGKPYPLSDIGIIWPQILEKIKLRSMQLNHLKRWNRQTFMEKGAMSADDKAKYKQGIDGAIIEVEPGTIAQNKFMVPQYPTMQAEIFQIESLIQLDLDTIGGQTQTERGAPAATRTRTLGEVEMMLQGSVSRSDKRKDSLEDFLEEVAKKLIQLLKQFQLTPRYARSVNEDSSLLKQTLGQAFDGQGLQFSSKEIQGEYDLDVKAGSTIPLSKENRLKVLSQIIALGPGIGILPGGKVSRAVGKEILRDLGIKEAERAYLEEEAMLNAQQQMMGAQSAAGQPMLQAGPSGSPVPPPPADGIQNVL